MIQRTTRWQSCLPKVPIKTASNEANLESTQSTMHNRLNQKKPIRRGANEANSQPVDRWFRARAMIELQR